MSVDYYNTHRRNNNIRLYISPVLYLRFLKMIQFYLAWHTKALKIGLKTRDHASGDPSPSREDILITKKLATAGDIVGIKVPDHIIVAENGYTSMLEKGYLKTG